jgi:hypothetical protein
MDWLFNHPLELGLMLLVMLGVALELGYRVSAHFCLLEDTNRKDQLVAIRDGLFVLLSLLIGFTLALAGARFAERRSLLVEEAVSIATSYLRAGTLPQPYRDQSQSLFRNYVDSRLELQDAIVDPARFDAVTKRAKRIQEELWNNAAAVARIDRTAVTATYINSLNETIDLHEKRVAAFENRIPLSIWSLISLVALIAVFSRGLTLKSRFWPTLIIIPLTIAIVVGLIADLDASGSGWIRLDHRVIQRLKVDLNAESRASAHPAFRPVNSIIALRVTAK